MYVSKHFKQHIRIISEVSCDTEDWSNDAENSTSWINVILKYIKMENSYLKITAFTVYLIK